LALLLPAFALPPGEAHGQSFAGCRTLVTPPFEAVTFDRDIQAVFDRACIDCDNPGASEYSRHQLDLRRGHAYLALVNVPSRADPAFPRVQPFWPDGEVGSLLWWKVSCLPPPTGQAMPPPPARLLAEELRAIYTWILRGAPASDPRESGRRQPDASLSGIWFDPSVRGQGFSLHITDESPARAFLFWTTFGAGQDPAQGPDNRWIAGAGTVGPDKVVALAFFQAAGDVFDSASSPSETFPMGSGFLTFADCNAATLSYQIDLDGREDQGYSRIIALRRLVPSGDCK
jgi:hypothetical protein